MTAGKRSYGMGLKDNKLVRTMAKTRSIERVTVLSVVSADGKNYKPAIVFPGKEMHYRRAKNDKQTILDWLPSCYIYQNDPAGVNTPIFQEWVIKFVEETEA